MTELESSTEIELFTEALSFSYTAESDQKSAALDEATPEPIAPNGGAS